MLSWSGTIRSRQFYARGIGIDDTAAIQAAISSGAKVLKYGSGTFGLGAAGLTPVSDQDWVEAGSNLTTIKMLVAPTLDMIFSNAKSNFHYTEILFDGNGMLTPVGRNFPALLPCMYLSAPKNFSVTHCKFIGYKMCSLLTNIATNFKIVDNVYDRGSAAAYVNHRLTCSGGVGSEPYNGLIVNNVAVYCQISVNCRDTIVNNNDVSKWRFSAGVNTQADPACYNLTITNNHCHDSNQVSDISTLCSGRH